MNMSSLIKLANGIKNPNEAINMALDFLYKKNPEAGNIVKNLMKSKDAKSSIIESAQKGYINIEQLKKLKTFYGMASKMGLSKKVPDNIWKEAEDAINSASNNTLNKMSGF